MTTRVTRGIVGLAVGAAMLASVSAVVAADRTEDPVAVSTPGEKISDFVVQGLRGDLRPR